MFDMVDDGLYAEDAAQETAALAATRLRCLRSTLLPIVTTVRLSIATLVLSLWLRLLGY